MTTVITIFGAIGLGLLWYFSNLSKATYYRAIQPNETVTPQDGREARKKDMISKITRYSIIYMVACVSVTSLVWVMPKIKTVQAALNPTATATITLTPTATLTRTPTPTRMTSTPRATGTPASPTVRVSPTERVPPTPQIIYQNVPVTVIVNSTRLVPATVIVYQTVQVPATVIVYQTVMVTPTFTPTGTETPTETPTATLTPTSTPTETPTP